MISQVELREAQARENLEAKAAEYRAALADHQKKREAELHEYIAFLNDQVGMAKEYVPYLGDFQDMMFVCLESWMNASIPEQKMELLRDKINTKYSMRNLVLALLSELNKISQRQERTAWQGMIKTRPIRVESEFITDSIKKQSKAQFMMDSALDRDMRQLGSFATQLKMEISKLESERDALKAHSAELLANHRANKEKLAALYRTCSDKFNDIKAEFINYFGSKPTGSSLADQWISEIDGDITLQKLIAINREHKEEHEDAKADFNDLKNRFNEIHTRINDNYSLEDFSTMKDDKQERNRLHEEKQEAFELMKELGGARTVIFELGNSIKEMLNKFSSLDPDHSITKIIKQFEMDEDFDTYRSIGVSTKADRKRYNEQKQLANS